MIGDLVIVVFFALVLGVLLSPLLLGVYIHWVVKD